MRFIKKRRFTIAIGLFALFIFGARALFAQDIRVDTSAIENLLRVASDKSVAVFKEAIEPQVIESFQKTEIDYWLQGPQPFPPELFEAEWNAAVTQKQKMILGDKQRGTDVYLLVYGAELQPALRYNYELGRWEYSNDGEVFFPFSGGDSYWIRQGSGLVPLRAGDNVLLRPGERLGIGTFSPAYDLQVQGDAFFNELVTLNDGMRINNKIVRNLAGAGLRIENEVLEIDTASNLSFTGDWDFGEGRFQLPNDSSLPQDCEVGDVYVNTSAPDNQQIYICTDKNVWTAQGAGGGGVNTFLALIDTISSYTPGRILFETDSAVADSAALYWDYNNNRLGINETNPLYDVSVGGSLGIKESGANPQFYTVFKGADQSSDIVYTLPASIGSGGYLRSDASGNLVWDNSIATVTPAPVRWDEILDPAQDKNFNMQAYKTSFTWGSSTGTGDLFSFSDSASNTGTGAIINISSATGSSMDPLVVNAQGSPVLNVVSYGQVGVRNSSPKTDLHVSGGLKSEESGFRDNTRRGYRGEEYFIDAYNRKYRYIDNVNLPEELWEVFAAQPFGPDRSTYVQFFFWSDYPRATLLSQALDHSTFLRHGSYRNVSILPPNFDIASSIWVYGFSGKDSFITVPSIGRFDTTQGITVIALFSSVDISSPQGIVFIGVDKVNDIISLSMESDSVLFATSVGPSTLKIGTGRVTPRDWVAVGGSIAPGAEGSTRESYLLLLDKSRTSGQISEYVAKGPLYIPRILLRREVYVGRSFFPIESYLNGYAGLVIFMGKYIPQEDMSRILYPLLEKFTYNVIK